MTIKAKDIQTGDYINFEGAAYEVAEFDGYIATLVKLAGKAVREVHFAPAHRVQVF